MGRIHAEINLFALTSANESQQPVNNRKITQSRFNGDDDNNDVIYWVITMYSSKHFVCTNLFVFSPTLWNSYYYPHFINVWGSDRLSNVLNITQLVNGKAVSNIES